MNMCEANDESIIGKFRNLGFEQPLDSFLFETILEFPVFFSQSGSPRRALAGLELHRFLRTAE